MTTEQYQVEFFNGKLLWWNRHYDPYSCWKRSAWKFTLMQGTLIKGNANVSALIAIMGCHTNAFNRKHSRVCGKRPVHSGWQHRHHLQDASDTDGRSLKVEFINGRTCWKALQVLSALPDNMTPLGVLQSQPSKGMIKEPLLFCSIASMRSKATLLSTVAYGLQATPSLTQGATQHTANAPITTEQSQSEFFNGKHLVGNRTLRSYQFAWTKRSVGSLPAAKARIDKEQLTVSASVQSIVVAKVNVASGESFTLVNADTNQRLLFLLIKGMQIDRSIDT